MMNNKVYDLREDLSEDLSESVADGSSVGDSGSLDKTSDKEKKQVLIADSETKTVQRLKFFVLAVLGLLAVGVALAVYFYTSGSEQEEFQVEFEGHSTKVFEGIGAYLEKTLGVLDALQSNIVASARETNQTWPFVTIKDFAVRTSKIRLLTDLSYISVNPLVTKEQRLQWEAYALENQGWVNESMRVQATDEFYFGPIIYNYSIHDVVFNDYGDMPYSTPLMLPTWQSSPVVPLTPPFNWDYLGIMNPEGLMKSLEEHRVILSPTYGLPDMSNEKEVAENDIQTEWYRDFVPPDEDPGEPRNDIYYPIVDSDLSSIRIVDNEEDPKHPKVVGLLAANFFWRDLMENLLPIGSEGLIVVFSSKCSPDFTYQIDGPETTFLGRGDLHERQFDSLGIGSALNELNLHFLSESHYTGIPLDSEFCPFSVKVYPSTTMQAQHITNQPTLFAIGAAMIFVFTSAVFLFYDFYVERRQKKVMTTAVRTNAIVSSLFPSVVRDRLFQSEEEPKDTGFKLANAKTRLKSFLSDGTVGDDPEALGNTENANAPIAELFPNTTVLFADIAGFTAWSSVREPTQVFTLLETLYGAFDVIARKRGVFKVETIGDSYVAVCGLPEPRADHAVVMAKFASDCRVKMNSLTRKLEKSLGPDTSDLKLRFGLNSGPVTAGVLRGERARFQLFGDTVNCAARMESNGKPNMIQASPKTADLLFEAGKGHWLKKREELVNAKGKGTMQTYWVDIPCRLGSVGTDKVSEASNTDSDATYDLGMSLSRGPLTAEKMERLLEWNVDAFEGLLKRIAARRVATTARQQPPYLDTSALVASDTLVKPRSEVTEVIMLPEFKFNCKVGSKGAEEVELSPEVLCQLREYIATIAYMYRPNPFHNFEHASHVAMSILKLLQRVVSPDISLACKNNSKLKEELASNLHSSTYGITSDPLTQFAIVFAALIHDVDHPGVSNGQLVSEHDPLALHYDNLSVAEQNSVAIAWQLLMRPAYADLRACLFETESDIMRFRQLVVNAVMATDIFDKDLKAMREARWEKAFRPEEEDVKGPLSSEDVNRKATIVIEHLIQAADVAHTMQHWAIYQKWNKQLFREMYIAFKSGRSTSDPAIGWYKGELWFFDNYIIPLAKKLRECHVFGVSCDEFLNYAIDNRTEWEAKGEVIVAEFVELMGPSSNVEQSQTPDPASLLEI